MKLQIDNLDGHGPRDYTSAIDGSRSPQLVRRLNRPSELKFSLVATGPDFVVPASGARVALGKTNGQDVFTGYLMQAPVFEYLGWGERGPVYRYDLIARSDEASLDRKRLPNRSPFVDRGGGNALRQLTEDLLPGVFDTSAVQDVDSLAWYLPDPQKTWSEHAAEIGLEVRGSYRTMNGALLFSPTGSTVHAIDEDDPGFSPAGLSLSPANGLVNDVTVIGRTEPQDYVKDYFVGDGLTLKFYLSQTPFSPTTVALVDEEYAGTALDPTRWMATDPSSALTVSAGKLQVAGGTGLDGQTTVTFAEKIELGGALVLQHGDVVFNASSDGVLGGLYPITISVPGCLAGFRITPSSGGQSSIQALVSGVATGMTINTIAGHHYAFTTRFYSTEIYREQQTFHSAGHPAGSGFGGDSVAADLRVVLEVHQTDPANPATLIAPSTVLYDGMIGSVGGFCAYILVNAFNLNCTIPFTRIQQPADVTVRSAIPGQSYRTRLVGLLTDGAECAIVSSPALSFFPQHAPVSNELIEVQYRGPGRGLARVTNAASILAQQEGSDDGVRGSVREIAEPSPRTSADCENAALALLDATGNAWSGAYETWGDFLPGNAADIFPGDAVSVDVPSRNATFQAIVREVGIEIRDLREEHIFYTIQFADDVAAPLAFVFQAGKVVLPLSLISMTTAQVGALFLPSLTGAEITQATSTTVSVDAGVEPSAGGGIEVRWSDFGWGQANDRNLAGRFSTRTFNLTRLAAVQNYFLRQFDNSTPPRYSRYTTALHLKFPL